MTRPALGQAIAATLILSFTLTSPAPAPAQVPAREQAKVYRANYLDGRYGKLEANYRYSASFRRQLLRVARKRWEKEFPDKEWDRAKRWESFRVTDNCADDVRTGRNPYCDVGNGTELERITRNDLWGEPDYDLSMRVIFCGAQILLLILDRSSLVAILGGGGMCFWSTYAEFD